MSKKKYNKWFTEKLWKIWDLLLLPPPKKKIRPQKAYLFTYIRIRLNFREL